MVTMVLLKVDWMCATPAASIFRFFFFAPERLGFSLPVDN